MKKIQTLLMMFSLFFLFSFSFAATATVTVIDNNSNELVYIDDNENLTTDFEITFNLANYSWTKSYSDYILYRDTGTYYLYVFNPVNNLKFYYDSDAIHNPGTSSEQEASLIVPIVDGSIYSSTNFPYLYYSTTKKTMNTYYPNNRAFYPFSYNHESSANKFSGVFYLGSSVPVYEGDFAGILNSTLNATVTCIFTDNVVLQSLSNPPIVMENPLTDAEIKSILEIFLESVRDADLPEHYGRYVLTYNKITGKYSGFVYPNYVDLGIEYHDFDDEGNRYRCLSNVGPYYNFLVYHENNDYIDNLLDSVSLLFKDHYIYEFRSNSSNTSFKFLESYSLFGTSLLDADIPFLLSTGDEPIIYTSHKIFSMFFIGNDLGVPNYVVDYNTSIDNQIFTDDSGVEFDNTLNEYTESTDVNVGLFDFIRLLFGFIFSLVSFLSRFFVFIVSFVMVPVSTNILPSEFVTGIEWLHTFAFGDILLWDIFSILFLVLLSIFIVNLIRSH